MANDEKRDEIRIGPPIAPGVYSAVRRNDEGESVVAISPAKDGDPMHPGTELADISHECRDGWHELRSIYKNGPAQVATPAYREGYDRIFGKKPGVGLA